MFLSSIFKKLLLRNHVVDFVKICNVCARWAIIEAAKRIINSDKVCRSYSDLNFGVTFWNTVYVSDLQATVLFDPISNPSSRHPCTSHPILESKYTTTTSRRRELRIAITTRC